MNKKITHLCEVLEQLFLPITKHVKTPIIRSLTPYAVLKVNFNSVQLNISLFTIYHLEIVVYSKKNILCTIPPDFDDRELDEILVLLTAFYQQEIEKLTSKEHRKEVLLYNKSIIESELKAIEDNPN